MHNIGSSFKQVLFRLPLACTDERCKVGYEFALNPTPTQNIERFLRDVSLKQGLERRPIVAHIPNQKEQQRTTDDAII